MKMNPTKLAAVTCIIAAAFIAGCQHQKKQARKPALLPPDRSATTAYNSSELPPAANRTDSRPYRNARIINTGLNMGPTLPPAAPVTSEMQER